MLPPALGIHNQPPNDESTKCYYPICLFKSVSTSLKKPFIPFKGTYRIVSLGCECLSYKEKVDKFLEQTKKKTRPRAKRGVKGILKRVKKRASG